MRSSLQSTSQQIPHLMKMDTSVNLHTQSKFLICMELDFTIFVSVTLIIKKPKQAGYFGQRRRPLSLQGVSQLWLRILLRMNVQLSGENGPGLKIIP